MNKKISIIISLISLIVLFYFCILGYSPVKRKKIENNNCSVAVKNIEVDNYYVKGTNEQYFMKEPEKALIIGENFIDTVIEIGAINNISEAVVSNVNKIDSKNYELLKEYNEVMISNGRNLNMEYVTGKHPDLIMGIQCVFTKNRLKNTRYWNDQGVNTLIPINSNSPSSHIYIETIEKEMQYIEDLGKVFHKEANAEKIIRSTYNTIDIINEKTKKLKKPKVMVIEFIGIMVSYDDTKLVGNMIERIGGEIASTSAVIGFENIIEVNPDILFVVCSHNDYGECINKVIKNEGLKNLKCVKQNNVYSIPLKYTYASLCRTEEGIKFLSERMYPQVKL